MKIVKGGSEYEQSIMKGVAGLEGIAKPDDVVMIYWAASPFINGDMIISESAKEKAMPSLQAVFIYSMVPMTVNESRRIFIARPSLHICTAKFLI